MRGSDQVGASSCFVERQHDHFDVFFGVLEIFNSFRLHVHIANTESSVSNGHSIILLPTYPVTNVDLMPWSFRIAAVSVNVASNYEILGIRNQSLTCIETYLREHDDATLGLLSQQVLHVQNHLGQLRAVLFLQLQVLLLFFRQTLQGTKVILVIRGI